MILGFVGVGLEVTSFDGKIMGLSERELEWSLEESYEEWKSPSSPSSLSSSSMDLSLSPWAMRVSEWLRVSESMGAIKKTRGGCGELKSLMPLRLLDHS